MVWASSQNNVQTYFKVITTTSSDDITAIEKFEIDANTYANVASSVSNYTTQAGENVTVATSKETRTYYDYEIEENENKREINLLKIDFLPTVEKEFKKVFNL